MDLKSQENVNSTSPEAHKAKGRKQAVPYFAYVAMGTVLYGGIWSYIGILKILSLNAYVFDLGINSERGWQVLHTNLGIHGYLATLINSGIVYPLSPLTGSGNFFAMVIFQAFAIALVGPALYLIAKEKGLKSRESMLLSLAFFLYFPVYGIMWFDFHYQVFFMPLFIFAYLFYLKKNYGVSTLLFFLSGIVRYPYSIFPLAFALIELVLIYRNRSSGFSFKQTVSMSILLAIMVAWTLLGYLLFGISSTIPHSGLSQYTVTDTSIWSKLFVILILLAPLLFLPTLKMRWIVLALPAFFLFLGTSYTWYAYPHVFQGQYTAGVAPFLFLGLIDYLGLSVKGEPERNKKWNRRLTFLRKRKVTSTIVAVLVILLLLNIFFAPFSPLNNQYGDQFNFYQNTSYNAQQYSELGSMLKLIPSNDPYVAYQNNIPEVLPRYSGPSGALLMGGYLGSFNKISVGEALNNSWEVNAGGTIVSTPVDYALADASNPNFYLAGNSTYSIVQDMYKSGKYGILSEGYGLILLQRGYNGTIKNYVPENVSISGNSFSYTTSISSHSIGMVPGNSTITISKSNGTPLYLFPGHFTIAIYLNSKYYLNSTGISSLALIVYSSNNSLLSIPGNITEQNSTSGFYKLTFSFTSNTIAGNVWYSLNGGKEISGTTVSKMVVTQTGPINR